MASNGAASTASALPMMEKLSPSTFVYRPATGPSSAAPTGRVAPPKLILIDSWMDARDVHIAKYITKYQTLYPSSQILLVKCTLAHIKAPKTSVEEMRPAVPVIRAALGTTTAATAAGGNQRPELLIHIFSNGGSISLNYLYTLYRDSVRAGSGESPLLPPHCTIIDSAPGRWSFRRNVNFLLTGFTSRWIRPLVTPFLYGLAAWWYLVVRFWLRRDALKEAGDAHNDRANNATEVKRVYIYSEADKLVDPRGVEQNAAEATKLGFDVRLENFGDSPHVAHARTDEKRYWRIVKELWEGVD